MTSIVLIILKCIFVKTSSSEMNHTFYVITDYTTWLVKSKRIQQGWKSKEMAECCKFYTLQQNPIISGHPFLTTYSAISLSAHANDNLYFLSDSEWVLIKKTLNSLSSTKRLYSLMSLFIPSQQNHSIMGLMVARTPQRKRLCSLSKALRR